jgi:hypothetical protein
VPPALLAGPQLLCTGSSASQAVKLSFTRANGFSYLGIALQDPGSGLPLLFAVQSTGSSVSVAPVTTMQSQGANAAVELSSAAGAGSILVSSGLMCSMALLPSGQLVVSNISNRAQPVPLWTSPMPTQGSAPFRLVLSPLGSLAVLDSSGAGAGAWSSQTRCQLGPGPFLLQVRAHLPRPLASPDGVQ